MVDPAAMCNGRMRYLEFDEMQLLTRSFTVSRLRVRTKLLLRWSEGGLVWFSV